MLIATAEQRKRREQELADMEASQAKERDELRKNHGFTQTYPKGWQRIRELAKGNPGAVGLYSFFAEHLDPSCGAIIADQQFLADHLGVSRRTIIRWIDYLEEQKALVRIPISGKICAYALDPHEVWKGYNNSKDYAAFVTKTLVNNDGEIRRKIMSMFSVEER
jgi:hypothetical protein